MNILESVYVVDRSGKKFSFEKGINDYDKLKELLLSTATTNTVLDAAERALGTHRYSKWYRVTLILAVAATWAILVAIFPWGVWTRGVTAADLDVLGLTALLIVAGVLGAFTVASEVPFVMKIDTQGIEARWLVNRRRILFTQTQRIKIGRQAPIETISIVDNRGDKIVFGRFLEDYDAVKRYLLKTCNDSKAGL